MRLLDFILGNKKEKQRLERERLAELERQHKAEEARIAKEREARLAENRRKEAERQARLRAQAEKQRLEKLAAELSKDFGSPASSSSVYFIYGNKTNMKKIDLAR